MHRALLDPHHSTGCWPQRMGSRMGFCQASPQAKQQSNPISSILGKLWTVTRRQ